MLLMSRTSEESVQDNLHPADIRGLDFNASLVVLSRTAVAAAHCQVLTATWDLFQTSC